MKIRKDSAFELRSRRGWVLSNRELFNQWLGGLVIAMNEVIRFVHGEFGDIRARIVKISDTAFRVDVEQRYAGTDAGGFSHGDFWAPLRTWTSYTDTVERALEIAAENIRSREASA